MVEYTLKEYINHALRVLKDFKVTLTPEEIQEFKALPTIGAVDRRKRTLIDKRLREEK